MSKFTTIVHRQQGCSTRKDERRGRLDEADSRHSRLCEQGYKIWNEFGADWRPVRLRRRGGCLQGLHGIEVTTLGLSNQMHDNLQGLSHPLCDNKVKQSRQGGRWHHLSTAEQVSAAQTLATSIPEVIDSNEDRHNTVSWQLLISPTTTASFLILYYSSRNQHCTIQHVLLTSCNMGVEKNT